MAGVTTIEAECLFCGCARGCSGEERVFQGGSVLQVKCVRDSGAAVVRVGGDVLFLARHFLADYARDLRKPLMRFSREAEELLQQQVFLGNVRLLKNAVERAAILCGDGEVGAEDLGFDLAETSSTTEISSMPAERVVDQVVQSLSDKQMNLPAVEKALIQEALRRTGGNQAHAAEILGISRMVLRNKMKRCGLL